MKCESVKTERENLFSEWENIVLNEAYKGFDIESFAKLLYKTYFFFYGNREYNSVLRDDLPIFRLVCVFSAFNYYPAGYRESHFRCCQMFAEGLCFAAESGFRRGYYKQSLPLLPHIAPDEADMSTFESFSKHFATCLECYEEAYAESEEEYWNDCENNG